MSDRRMWLALWNQGWVKMEEREGSVLVRVRLILDCIRGETCRCAQDLCAFILQQMIPQTTIAHRGEGRAEAIRNAVRPAYRENAVGICRNPTFSKPF